MDNCDEINSAELLWRRARAKWEIIQIEDKNIPTFAISRNERVSKIQELVDLLDQALEVDETCSAAHRWKAVLSEVRSSRLGLKEQFQNLETKKYHLERAVELDPNDAAAMTMLGAWHMTLLELTLPPRIIAFLFLKMPKYGSYEDALQLFLRAEEIAPNTSIANVFLAGKAYYRYVNLTHFVLNANL